MQLLRLSLTKTYFSSSVTHTSKQI